MWMSVVHIIGSYYCSRLTFMVQSNHSLILFHSSSTESNIDFLMTVFVIVKRPYSNNLIVVLLLYVSFCRCSDWFANWLDVVLRWISCCVVQEWLEEWRGDLCGKSATADWLAGDDPSAGAWARWTGTAAGRSTGEDPSAEWRTACQTAGDRCQQHSHPGQYWPVTPVVYSQLIWTLMLNMR